MATARTAASLVSRSLRKLTVRSGPAGTSATTCSASCAKGFETDFRSSRRWSCLARIAEAPEALIFEVE